MGVCLLFTILHPFGTRESIRRKVDHGGQIVKLLLMNQFWEQKSNFSPLPFVVGLAYQGEDIVFRFIIEYSSLREIFVM
jgi:hypothetical protein